MSSLTKSQAWDALDEFRTEFEASRSEPSRLTLSKFLATTYFPVYTRKWKRSSTITSANRIKIHIQQTLGAEILDTLTREKLQKFLDARLQLGLSSAIVKQMRWDLRQIFALAQAEGVIKSNPGEILFVQETKREPVRVMTSEQVRLMLSVLAVRELLIAKLATLCGIRPGEIVALQWKHYCGEYVNIEQRVYHADLDKPKNRRSVRFAGLSNGTSGTFELWRSQCISTDPECWVFPSDNLDRPSNVTAIFRDWIRPQLKKVGLGWVNFQAMRQFHSSRMRELGQDPKHVADQVGHGINVDLNVYTRTSVESRRKTLQVLEDDICAEAMKGEVQ